MPDNPLDILPPEDIIALMDEAEQRAVEAVRSARTDIALAAEAAAHSIRTGGRLIYVGAGTSGRLGVLDASECPPTFSSDPVQVTGVIAGGDEALRHPVEGAEDDEAAGREAVRREGACEFDMVVGISASGTTPFVLAALDEAATSGAAVWLVTCSPVGAERFREAFSGRANAVLTDTGDEVIQGSTRLAAGTATKLVLNRITTTAFIIMGKVYDDLMVDVVPTNAKLARRAAGIVERLCGCTPDEAVRLLELSGNRPKVAVVMGAGGLERLEAAALLDECGGSLRKALGRL